MKTNKDNSELGLLSVSDAAKQMHLGIARLGELINQGMIGWVLIGKRRYIPWIEIERFIAENIRYNFKEETVVNDLNNSPVDINSMDIFDKMIGEL